MRGRGLRRSLIGYSLRHRVERSTRRRNAWEGETEATTASAVRVVEEVAAGEKAVGVAKDPAVSTTGAGTASRSTTRIGARSDRTAGRIASRSASRSEKTASRTASRSGRSAGSNASKTASRMEETIQAIPPRLVRG
jgi:hypothetical protein